MGGYHLGLARHTELLDHVDGMLHHIPVALTAHDDADYGFTHDASLAQNRILQHGVAATGVKCAKNWLRRAASRCFLWTQNRKWRKLVRGSDLKVEQWKSHQPSQNI
jgi:hypothetical protein